MDGRTDVIIIGGGPAGLTAAIYASRANLSTLVVEEAIPGGKLAKTWQIENYPGVEKINGADLGMQMFQHSTQFGAEFTYGQVTAVAPEDGGFRLTMADGSALHGRTVIVATGTAERRLDLPQAEQLTGHGISYCAVCDGNFYKGLPVAVIGGGNSALEESLYLAKLASTVTIVIRRDVFRADPIVQSQIQAAPNIKVVTGHVPHGLVVTDGRLTGLQVAAVADGAVTTIPANGVFPYIGADPATGFLAGLGVTDEKGYIKAGPDMATAIDGLYAAGDVIVKDLRQVVTAVNDGAIAATSAARYIRSQAAR